MFVRHYCVNCEEIIYWESGSIPKKEGIVRCSERTTTISIDFARDDFAYCAKHFNALSLQEGFVHQLHWYANRQATYAKDLVCFNWVLLGRLEFEFHTVMN